MKTCPLNPDELPARDPTQFQEARVFRDGATVHIVGHITLRSYRRILSVVREIVVRTGYQVSTPGVNRPVGHITIGGDNAPSRANYPVRTPVLLGVKTGP